jgi:CBS domain containing-hemolysin-like protein
LEELVAIILGGLSLLLVLFFSLADGALSEFSWLKMEKRLGSRAKLKVFSDRERSIAISAKVLATVFSVTFAVAVLYVVTKEMPRTGFMAFGLAAGIVAAGLLLFDMVPDLLGRRNPESVLGLLLPVLFLLEIPLRPLTRVLTAVAEVFARLLGFPRDETSAVQIEGEILSAITEGKHEGVFTDGEDKMMQKIIEFKNVQISEIMTPRTDTFALPADTTLREAARKGFELGHSRIPVFAENLDDVTGVLYMKDLFGTWGDGESEVRTVSELARKPYFVPETKLVGDLLVELRSNKVHIAIVMDEYGGTAGIITIEDIIEEIVGEIEDEYDPESPSPLSRVDENTALVDARLHVDELNEEFGTAIPESDTYETVSGFLSSQTGSIPAIGERVRFDGLTFTILDADERSIKRVKVVKSGSPDE